MTAKPIALLFLFLSGALPALAADPAAPMTPPRDAYRAVMDAQYAARGRAGAQRPEEAQAIYDTYIKRIGQPARDRSDLSDNSGVNTGTAPR